MMSLKSFLFGCVTACLMIFAPNLKAEEATEEQVLQEEILYQESPVCLMPYKGKIGFSYHNHTQNDNFNELSINGKISQEAFLNGCPHYKWSSEIDTEWKQKGGESPLIDKGRFNAKYQERFAPSWVWRAEHETLWGQKRNLHYRFSTGLGAGYYVYETSDFSIQPKSLLRQVDSKFRKNDLDLDEHGLWPAIGYIVYAKLPFSIELNWDFEYQVSMENFDRERVYSDIELTVPCGLGWVIDLEYESIYRNKVAQPGVKHYDADLRIKLGYCF